MIIDRGRSELWGLAEPKALQDQEEITNIDTPQLHILFVCFTLKYDCDNNIMQFMIRLIIIPGIAVHQFYKDIYMTLPSSPTPVSTAGSLCNVVAYQ